MARLYTACPHTQLIVNDDADADEPVGWTLRTEGCETVEITGTDLRDLLDKQERFDAARGVQPAAKEEAGFEFDANAQYYTAAQQPSAPTTETDGKWEQQDCAVRIKHKLIHVGSHGAAIELVRLHHAALDAKDEQLAHDLKLKEQAERELHAQDVELNALREQLRVMRDAIERFFQWASADAIPNDWPRDNEGDPILPAELLRRALASAPAARQESARP